MQISVVIPVFNGEAFLAEAIDSVLNQTYQDFELILVNDGSTDNSLKIMQNYAAIDKRIKIISQENQGRCEAFNRGLNASKSEWVARLDADDVFLPNKLEKQVDFIKRNPQTVLVGTQGYHIDKYGRKLSLMGIDGPFTQSEYETYLRQNKPIFFIASSVLMRRDKVLAVGGMRKEMLQAEDLDLWNRVAEQGGTCLKIPEPLVLYRIHEGSISTRDYLAQRMYYKWVRDCMIARRSGQQEPSLAEFLEIRKRRPWYKKINSFRKDYGKYFYRMAALNYAMKKYVKCIFYYISSAIIHPEHAIPRVIQQSPMHFFKYGIWII